MSARYGIRRFALLNTAGYSLGLFPLEQPLSIYGANNLGKSASINALQFPILARLSDMSFGKYSTEQSKRFYFASDTSYILIEVLLPHGPHVIGVAGRGPGGGFGHQFFAYAGGLDLAHYQRDGQSLRQRELFSQLDKNGIKAYELKPDELRRLLVGGHTQIPLDLTLIPLRSTSEQSLKTFRALFINLLHMREITASKLKQLFLDAFEHSLRSASVDYITACDEAFRDVRRMEQDFNALQQAASAIDALSQGVQQRDKLRGKLHALSLRIDDLVSQSRARFSAEQDELKARQAALSDEQQQLQATQREATQQLANLGGERQKISQWLAEFDSLQQRFSLVPHAEQLDQHLQAAKDQHDELAGALSQARHFSRADVDARARDLETRLRELEKSLSLAANPLYSQLREHFSESEVDQLMRLFHSRLFDLPLDESGLLGESDWPQLLKPLLQGFDGTRFNWQGLRIDLSSIQPPALQSQAERQSLLDQQDRLQRELKQVHAQQQVMQNQEASQNALKGFYQQVMDAQNALEQFTYFQQLQPQYTEQCERQAQLDEQAANAQAQAERFAEQVQQLAQQHQQLQGQLNALTHRQQAITDALKRRPLLPSTLPAGSPWLEPISEEPEQLLPLIQDYADTWQQLQRVDAQIEALYAQVRLKGVAKFDGEADPERRIQLLLNAYQHRNEEALTLARARRAAVTDIARTLRNIRNDYDSLEHQLNLFNREINRRQVSNLESFRIVLAPHKEALQHIDHIIHSAKQYEKGETLSVFDFSQDSIDTNQTDAARDYLAKMVAANQNQLGLRDLFELAFEITKRGGAPVLHTDIDGAASNGTTMTIKALTNMYLLLHLMDRDRAGKVRLPYYLDEAADIDEANQQALIETSALLGFTPILASVKPQVSARVAIDLEAGSGPEGIYLDEQDWKLIQPAPLTEPAESALS